MLGSAASGVASALDRTGDYLQDQGLSGMGGDFTNLIRRNPIPALLIGVAVGFLLARVHVQELIMADRLQTTETGSEPSVTSLLSGIVNDAQELIKQQLELFKHELKDDMKRAQEGLPSLGLGVALAVAAIFLLGMTIATCSLGVPRPAPVGQLPHRHGRLRRGGLRPALLRQEKPGVAAHEPRGREGDRGERRMANETEVIREKMEATRTDLSDKIEQLEKQVVDTVQEATSTVADAVQGAKDVVDP